MLVEPLRTSSAGTLIGVVTLRASMSGPVGVSTSWYVATCYCMVMEFANVDEGYSRNLISNRLLCLGKYLTPCLVSGEAV